MTNKYTADIEWVVSDDAYGPRMKAIRTFCPCLAISLSECLNAVAPQEPMQKKLFENQRFKCLNAKLRRMP